MNGGPSMLRTFGQPSSTGKRAGSPVKGGFSVRRWETFAAMSVATLGLMAPAAVRADVPGYTFKIVAQAKGDFQDGSSYQMGGVNNKGQMSFVVSVGGERVYAYDGTK